MMSCFIKSYYTHTNEFLIQMAFKYKLYIEMENQQEYKVPFL